MQLNNVPIIAYSTCVCIEYNGKLYINITDTNKIGHMYEYNINKDAYTEIENPPSNFRGDFISYNGYLNCLGTYDRNNECEENKYHQVYKVNMKNLFNESNTVYILNNKQNNQYKTCFISSYKQIMGANNKFFLEFNDAFYCDKNKKIDKNQEAYYGDGTQWIRFK